MPVTPCVSLACTPALPAGCSAQGCPGAAKSRTVFWFGFVFKINMDFFAHFLLVGVVWLVFSLFVWLLCLCFFCYSCSRSNSKWQLWWKAATSEVAMFLGYSPKHPLLKKSHLNCLQMFWFLPKEFNTECPQQNPGKSAASE